MADRPEGQDAAINEIMRRLAALEEAVSRMQPAQPASAAKNAPVVQSPPPQQPLSQPASVAKDVSPKQPPPTQQPIVRAPAGWPPPLPDFLQAAPRKQEPVAAKPIEARPPADAPDPAVTAFAASFAPKPAVAETPVQATSPKPAAIAAAEPPAASPPPGSAEPKPIVEPKPRASLEQIIGAKWMLIAGVVVLIVAGGFFFKLAYDLGWFDPTRRLVIGGAFGLAMIGGGQYVVRRGLRLYASALLGLGIVWLYMVIYTASPSGVSPDLHVMQTNTLPFILMCVVTAIGMGLAVQTGMQACAIISLAGAIATPILLSTGEDRQATLMCYLLAIDAGFLLLAYWRRWLVLAPLAMLGSAVLFAGWFASHYSDEALTRTLLWAWPLAGVFVAYVLASEVRSRSNRSLGQVMFVAAGGLMWGLLAVTCMSSDHLHALAVQMLVIAAGFLLVAYWRRWLVMAPLAMIGTVALFAEWFAACYRDGPIVPTLAWAWALAGVFVAYVLISDVRGRGTLGRNLLGQVMFVATGGLMWGLLAMTCMSSDHLHALAAQLLVIAAGFAVVAYWRRWLVMAPLAMIGTVALFADWFVACYRGDPIVPTLAWAWALAGVFVAYVLTSEVRNRGSRLAGQVMLVAAGGLIVGLLEATCTSSPYVHAFAIQLFVIAAGLLAYATWRNTPALAACVNIAAASVLGWWLFGHIHDLPWTMPCMYGWMMLALPAGTLALRRTWDQVNELCIGVAAAWLVVAWALSGRTLPLAAVTVQLLVLNLAVLAICQWRRWHGLRVVWLIWTAFSLLCLHLRWQQDLWTTGDFNFFSPDGRFDVTWYIAGWTWGFYALFMTDILIRAFKRSLQTYEPLDAVLACVATGLMFGGTYMLMDRVIPQWTGLYTVGLSSVIAAIVWTLHSLARRTLLASVFLGQALVLLAVAAPIQFENSILAIAWAAEGLAGMLLARWLGRRLPAVFSIVVMALAMGHYLMHDLALDPAMQSVLLDGPTPITGSLAMLALLTAVPLLAAGVLRWGKRILSGQKDLAVAFGLVLVAALVFAVRTATELPPVTAGWWWLVLAGILAAVGLWKNSSWLTTMALALSLAAACKWVVYDTLGCRADLTWTAVLNWQFGLGVALTAAILFLLRQMRRRFNFAAPACAVLGAFGALLVVWAGSFEVARYFSGPHSGDWVEPGQAMQMTLSLWWGLYAAAVLVIGFALSLTTARYVAIGVFAITVGKVFFIDLSHVQMVYRVAVLMGVGLLLLAGSWLYHRQTKVKK